jgi:hypothetical protein
MCIENWHRAFDCLLLMLLAAVWSRVALAQTAPAARYPWDQRSQFCFKRDTPRVPECASDNWPSCTDTVQRVTYLYELERFDLLERALKERLPRLRTSLSMATLRQAPRTGRFAA